jgi:phage/plasmid-associated DNA primase
MYTISTPNKMLSKSSIKYLADRGITEAYQGYFIELDQGQLSKAMGKPMHCGGFSASPDLIAPGSSIQGHPETPFIGRDGKPQKWVTPIGDTAGFFSFEPLSDEYVIITEGVVKALAIYQNGYNALSINGVENWSVPGKDDEGKRQIKPALLRHLPPVVYMAYDTDWSSNKNVLRALTTLAEALIDSGREVRVMSWDPNLKGIDDYLAPLDTESRILALETMMQSAPEFNEFITALDVQNHQDMREIKEGDSPEWMFEREMITLLGKSLLIPVDQFHQRNPVAYVWDASSFSFTTVSIEAELIHQVGPFLTSLYKKEYKKTSSGWKEVEIRGFNNGPNLTRCMARTKSIIRALMSNQRSTPDADRNKIRFNNGVYDLRKNFLDTSDASYLSVSAGYSLSNLPSPNFDAWLASSFEGLDKSVILAVMRFLVDPTPRHEKLIHIYGTSGSGKGLFCRLMGRLLGHHHVSQSPLDGLSEPDKIRQALREARLCIDSDHHGLLGDPTLIYKIVSNEPIDVRDLYTKTAQVDTNPRRILMASIQPLNIKAASGAEGGWIRRCLPIKTQCKTKIEGIEDRVYTELGSIMSQILALSFDDAIAILNRYESTQVNPKDKAAENPVAIFMRAHVVPDESAKEVSPAMLFKIYKDWSQFRGIKPMSLSTFNRRLDDLGLRPKVEGKVYVGIAWIDQELQRMTSDHYSDNYNPAKYSVE